MRSEQVPPVLADMQCPDLGAPDAVTGVPLDRRRVSLISTAGLMHAGDRPFGLGSADYRILDLEDERPLQMTHVSTNFDRSGFAMDTEVVLPLAALSRLAAEGEIGSVARYHYSFMGATEPEPLQPAAEDLAGVLAGDGVDLACLVPV